ncbi:MAG TPA: winged helix-turn-helix domain-containing protein, partial [Catenuloplanes sp.]
MEFGVLGPLIVGSAGRTMTIGSRQQRRLLTALLVHSGTVVSVDRLTDVLWGDEAPRAAVPSLHTYVSRLRALLHTDGEEILLTRPPGYLLRVDPGHTDAGRFERLVAAARATAADQPSVALQRLDEALALWRG